MAHLAQDVKYGIRMLMKKPGFTAIAVLTLALGIGANTAIFSIVQAVLLRQLPYRDPARLVEIWNTYLPQFPQFQLSGGDFHDWRRQVKSFSDMAAYWGAPADFNLTGTGDPERVEATYASSEVLTMLGVRPLVGRNFRPDEDHPDGGSVALISHRLWETRFGGDTGALGKTLTLDGQNFTVVGVLPGNVHLVPGADVWLPMGAADPNEINTRVHHDWNVAARLAPGATTQQAQAELTTLEQQETLEHPDTNRNFGVTVLPMRDPEAVKLKTPLLVLFAAVGLVLLICCANLVNLVLARNATRQREIAIRTALGASPVRMVRQLLTETVLLALLGGLAGLLLAVAGLRTIAGFAPPNVPGVPNAALNPWVLGFTLGISFLTGVLAGLLPARHSLRADLNDPLKEGSKVSSGLGMGRVRNALVVAEVALAIVPLTGAGLLLRSFGALLGVNPGFRADHLLTMQVPQPTLPTAVLSKMTVQEQLQLGEKQAGEFQQLAERIQSLPGVKSVGGITILPVAETEEAVSRFVIEGQPQTEKPPRPAAELRTPSLDYFSTMGIPLLQGRLFTAADWTLRDILINQHMARQFFPAGDAIGKRINVCSLSSQPCWYSIIGVVGDVHEFGLNTGSTFDIYFSGGWTDYIVVRTAADPAALASAVREEIRKFDPNLPISHLLTMEQLLADSLSQQRFLTLLLGIFAALALLLSAVGIYGVLSYTVGERTNEIGIRMALGAAQTDVLAMVIGQGAKLAVIGVAIGIAGGLAVTRLLSTLLFGVSAKDPVVFCAVAVLLLGVAVAACYVPARRAMQIDPLAALRYE